ncbi:MAG: thioesterase family protein [Acetobacteraceae bacterium]|jgi:acyl-CoA thioester hydrolase
MLSVETVIKAQFFDLDPMNVVWHGNYARFLEIARSDLLDRMDYNYSQMEASGFAFPIVEMRLKYVAPIRFRQDFVVTTTLIEYENRLRLDYVIRDLASGTVLTRARTTQVAVRIDTGELCLESPPVLIEKARALIGGP